MCEYLVDDRLVLDRAVRLSAITRALPPQSRHFATSMPGRPRLRGPVENSLESLCLYALWVQLMAT